MAMITDINLVLHNSEIKMKAINLAVLRFIGRTELEENLYKNHKS